MNDSCEYTTSILDISPEKFDISKLDAAARKELASNQKGFDCLFGGNVVKAVDFYQKFKKLDFSDVQSSNRVFNMLHLTISSNFRNQTLKNQKDFEQSKPVILAALSKYIIAQKYGVEIEGGFDNMHFESREFKTSLILGDFMTDRRSAVNMIKFMQILISGHNSDERIFLSDAKIISSMLTQFDNADTSGELTDTQFAILDIFFDQRLPQNKFLDEDPIVAANQKRLDQSSLRKKTLNFIEEFEGIMKGFGAKSETPLFSAENSNLITKITKEKIIPLMRKYTEKKFHDGNMYVSLENQK